jgi:catechol 1,2-dioxygenase
LYLNSFDKNKIGMGQGRRDFIRASILASAAAILPRFAFGATKLKPATCELTTSDIEGPFWEPNAPFQNVLAAADEPGERLIISGRVFHNNCDTPIANATVDVWGADNEGNYSATKLRGRIHTDKNGEYELETIFPAPYDQGNGQYRPRHLHYKVTSKDFPTLTTQLYFEGDEYIPADPWASASKAKNRIIPLKIKDGKRYGRFDIMLNILPGTKEIESFPGYLRQNFPNPFRKSTNINFGINSDMEVHLQFFDGNGKLVRTIVEQKLTRGRYAVQWDGLADTGEVAPQGSYICRLVLGNERVKEMSVIKS